MNKKNKKDQTKHRRNKNRITNLLKKARLKANPKKTVLTQKGEKVKEVIETKRKQASPAKKITAKKTASKKTTAKKK